MNFEETAQPINHIDDAPKIGFLEAFYGILFSPAKVFDDLYNEDVFTVLIYGILAVFLSSLGKLAPGNVSLLNIVGTEFTGFLSWFFVGLFIVFFTVVFKTPNNNFPRLLGFTGLSSLPFLLLTPISLISYQYKLIYHVFGLIIFAWAFTIFCIALSKSLKIEPWRVILLAIIPFFIGITGNVMGLMLSGM